MMKLKVLRDSFFFKQFMLFHSFNIKFSFSSFKRFNCLFKRCNFAFASRTSFRTRNRSLCTFRMMNDEMTRSQNFLDATHAKHFSNASPSKHCLLAKEQDLQRRMLMNKNSKFKKKGLFLLRECAIVAFRKRHLSYFRDESLRRGPNVTSQRERSILFVHDFVVTRILLEVLGERASMSRD